MSGVLSDPETRQLFQREAVLGVILVSVFIFDAREEILLLLKFNAVRPVNFSPEKEES
jgi:hypothetical protein